MKLLVDGGAPLAGGIIGAGGEIAWPNADEAGRRAAGDERGRRDHAVAFAARTAGWSRLRSETRNQNGEVVQVLTAKLVVPRRPAGAAP